MPLRAKRPLVVIGTLHRDPALLEAALAVIEAINARRDSAAWLTMAMAEANSLGAALLAGDEGMRLSDLTAAIEDGAVTTLVVTENDLFERFGDHARLTSALERLEHLIVLDHTTTATASCARHVFPVATMAECSGTLINNEGRLQRFYQVLRAPQGIAPAWSRARDLLAPLAHGDTAAGWNHFEDVTTALAEADPRLSAATEVAPPAGLAQGLQAIPRMSHRYSGRNATIGRDELEDYATQGMPPAHEVPSTVPRRTSDDPETPFAFSMEGIGAHPDPALLARVWAPGWNSNEAINQFQIEVGGPLHGGDPGRRIFSCNGTGTAIDPAPAAWSEAAAAAVTDGDALLVCATAEIFGSESLSRRAPALAELTPPPYLLLHPERAAQLGFAPGQARSIVLAGNGREVSLAVTIEVDPEIPRHVAAVPAGYPQTLWWQAPVLMHVRDAGEAGT